MTRRGAVNMTCDDFYHILWVNRIETKEKMLFSTQRDPKLCGAANILKLVS